MRSAQRVIETLAANGVTANCLHPGFVTTNLGQRRSGVFGLMVRVAMLFAERVVYSKILAKLGGRLKYAMSAMSWATPMSRRSVECSCTMRA